MIKLRVLLLFVLFVPQVFSQDIADVCHEEKRPSPWVRLAKDFDKTIAVMARNSWESAIRTKEKDWPFAAFLLRHSLQDYPDDLNFSPRSRASKLIKDSKEYKHAIWQLQRKLSVADEDKVITGTIPINFDNGDLYVALHSVTLNYSAQKVGDKWELEITVSDLYDFAHHNRDEVRNFKIRTINNMAYADQEKGIINPYNITFNIEESIEEISLPPSGILLEY